MSSAESMECRVHGPESAPALVYLPGIHGDWTLVGGFRSALGDRVRFIEFRYPRTLTWSLETYAGAVAAALREAGIRSGWVLAESFGSQVAWPLVSGRQPGFQASGLILAGGFGRYPVPWLARAVRPLARGIPYGCLRTALLVYRRVGRWRFRSAPDLARDLEEFVARRTPLDREAAVHRIDLILGHDPAPVARRLGIPVYALTGLWDPVVPWPGALRWLRRECPAFRGWRLIPGADHNVLGSGAGSAARQVLRWMGVGGEAARPRNAKKKPTGA